MVSKKQLLSIGILFLFFNSCKESGNDPVFQNCYITQFTDPNSKTTTTLTLDNNNLTSLMKMKLNSGGNGTTYSITYNQADQVTEINISNYGTIASYSYDANNNLIQDKILLIIVGSGSTGTITETENYSYNSSNQLVGIQVIMPYRDSTIYEYDEWAYDNLTSKNPTTISSYRGDISGKKGLPYNVTSITYDTQKNPFYGLVWSKYMNISLGYYVVYSPNNILSMTDSFGTNTKNSYQYNASSYPVSKTYQLNGTSYRYTYSYTCK